MAPPPSRRPRSPPALMEELVEEILLRIPPDEPAHLFRAALVCKPWRRIVSDPGFLRRYRAFHRAPLLLGYFHNLDSNARFISSTAIASPHFPLPTACDDDIDSRGLSWAHVHDCRHGRVLIEAPGKFFIVWDPITGDQKKVSKPDYYPYTPITSATVLCAVEGCDHLDCHAAGAFLVVCCGTYIVHDNRAWATMYNSDTGEWSSTIVSTETCVDCIECRPTLIIGDALYFSFHCVVGLLKYDLRRHELSMVETPGGAAPVELDDGELGFVAALENCIYTWSWRAEAKNGIGIWDQHKVMELKALLPDGGYMPEVIGFVEGTHTVFVGHDAGVFAIDIKSKKVNKVGKSENYYQIMPYMSFYTPRSC